MTQERIHQRERHHQNGQIDDPVALRGQPGVAQGERNLREERHQHRVQGERAEVETQQLGVGDNACKLTRNDGAVIGPVIGIGHRVADHGNRGDGENARQREYSRHADPRLEHGPRNERSAECGSYGDANDRHRPRAHGVAR